MLYSYHNLKENIFYVNSNIKFRFKVKRITYLFIYDAVGLQYIKQRIHITLLRLPSTLLGPKAKHIYIYLLHPCNEEINS